MNALDFISEEILQDQLVKLQNAAEIVHGLFCCASHEDECNFYTEQSWDEPDHNIWIDRTVRLIRYLGLKGLDELRTQLAAVQDIAHLYSGPTLTLLSMLRQPDSFSCVIDYDPKDQEHSCTDVSQLDEPFAEQEPLSSSDV